MKWQERRKRNEHRLDIGLLVEFGIDNSVTPRTIIWEDGRRFEIDRILDMQKCAALKAGGAGVRYICRVRGKEIALFFDESIGWFIEK